MRRQSIHCEETMTQTLLKLATLALFTLTAVPVLADKPANNKAGAVKYEWHLSGAVMPVPPYGSQDIPGSDTSSKLIVNQPNGKVLANMTGVMKGLTPSTPYTVYLSNAYTPYVFNGWDASGSWAIGFTCTTGCGGSAGPYGHSMSLIQAAGSISGSGGYPSGGPYTYSWIIDSGSVAGNAISFIAHYTASADAVTPLTTMHVNGTIAPDGTMSGTWDDNYQGGSRGGSWSTSLGQATANFTGDLGWPGFLTNVPAFTFTTDANGSGSWHVNLTSANITLPANFSVWINSSATILISDSVTLY